MSARILAVSLLALSLGWLAADPAHAQRTTGTQGVVGNPNCPAPVLPGGIVPKNWSCPTGTQNPFQQQPQQEEPQEPEEDEDQASEPEALPGCVIDVPEDQIEAMLAAQPDVCSRYGADQILCQAEAGQTDCSNPTPTFRVHALGHGPREPDPQTNPKGNPALTPYWDSWWDQWRQILEREVRDKMIYSSFDWWLNQKYGQGGDQLSSGAYCVRWQWLIYRDRSQKAYLFPAFGGQPYNGGVSWWQSTSRSNELELYTRPLVERALRQAPPFPTLPTSGTGTKAWALEQDLILNWNRSGPRQIYAGDHDDESRRQVQCPNDSGSLPMARGLLFN